MSIWDSKKFEHFRKNVCPGYIIFRFDFDIFVFCGNVILYFENNVVEMRIDNDMFTKKHLQKLGSEIYVYQKHEMKIW